MTPIVLTPGARRGEVVAPPSKSHAHRLLIANFLADHVVPDDSADDSADILATKRCLRALSEPTATPTLACGESGSTLRFLAPIAAALGKKPIYLHEGRLAARPFKSYETLEAGCHELLGNVSSQFVTGLLFALPLLAADSRIRFTTPLESRGYVEMTLQVVRAAGISVEETPEGDYVIPGGQAYRRQVTSVEGDWSGAAFWLAMNALGSDVRVSGLNADSAQPDRAIAALLANWPETIDVSQFPDIFPVLTVVAATRPQTTSFTGIARLRLKECDRVLAMEETLRRFGVSVRARESSFVVEGTRAALHGGDFRSFGDHRIAMSVAVGATRAESPVCLDDCACAAKSYPAFFRIYSLLETRTGGTGF